MESDVQVAMREVCEAVGAWLTAQVEEIELMAVEPYEMALRAAYDRYAALTDED